MHAAEFVTGAYAGLRASGVKADLALVVADSDAVVGGTFTTNVMCAAPVIYCRDVMSRKKTVRAVSACRDLLHVQ
jgi:glutamate N-acetyltransferase/amino-acid N-acetyltransferase